MAKSIFLFGTDPKVDKSVLVNSFLDCAQKNSCKIGYFKTIVKNPDCDKLKERATKIGLNARDVYGLALTEAVTLLNDGKDATIIEEVLSRFSQVAQRFDCVLVDGADLSGFAAFALQGLDAALAANLSSAVVIVAAEGVCLGASAVRYFKKNHAQVLALALVGIGTPDEVSKIEILKDVDVKFLSNASELSGLPALLHDKINAFTPKVVTPKRFEYDLIARAKSKKQRIVLPEGDDDRILAAADDILRRDFADIIVFGQIEAIKKKASELGLTNLSKAQLVDIKTASFRDELVNQFFELRKAKGITLEQANAQLNDRNWFGTMMVKAGKADGMVSGAAGTTADTIRPALSIIKTKPGCSIASSVFIMCMADRVLVFGDCAINPNPNPQQLAEIAIISAQTAKAFGVDPKVAMLSYSTGTSGTGPDVDAIHEATKIAKESSEKLYPGLALDGPMQFDAALDARTAKSKMPGSKVAGQATVLIFPSLNAGNIGYKAVQRTSGAVAVGPIIQGLNAPVNDLSRGCTVADIVNTVAITAAQAQADK